MDGDHGIHKLEHFTEKDDSAENSDEDLGAVLFLTVL